MCLFLQLVVPQSWQRDQYEPFLNDQKWWSFETYSNLASVMYATAAVRMTVGVVFLFQMPHVWQ